ncbi:PAS domain-containing protein [Citromicrobium bathyomarinum]|uniref:PAS domain-containing protein n=1 Tax=Citromicrobium bathyomarinum TaxID=72174 RepID=UPI00315AC9C5
MNEADTPKGTGVPAANFVRSFSKWRDEAIVKPVFIANHGRITHALISIAQLTELSHGHGGQAPDVNPFELAEWIDEAVIVCDRDLVVESMNRVASAACRLSSSQCIGRNLYETLPQLRGTLFDVHLMRTVEANESTSADIPSPLREGGWLRLQSFPLHERNVLLFRDITEEVERHRLADVKAALIEAMAVHNAIGYIRVTMSAQIERVDEPFCKLLGVREDRLRGANLVELVSRDKRVEFKSALQEAMSGEGPRRLVSSFISNGGETDDVVAAIVQLRGAYGAEGAVILLTPADISSPWGAKGEYLAKGE